MHKMVLLDNGLRVAAEQMGHMESISLAIWIRTGSRFEDRSFNGISHLLEHLLFKGTTTRDMKKIKEEIEGRGGSFNGFTAEEFTCYLVKVLSKDIELGVDILSDMVLNPRLDDEEMKKEKDVIIEEINMYKDIPSHYVHEILTEMLWPNQPLGMPLAGTAESVMAITKEKILSYKNEHYSPKNMLLVGTGRINEDDIVKLSKRYLSKPSDSAIPKFEKVKLGQSEPKVDLHFKETEQTHVALGLHAINRFHPDRYVLALLNIILGANMSSRLFHIVRDELAICYEISSSARLYDDDGVFVVGMGVDDKKLNEALGVVMRELKRMKNEPVPNEELKRAKEYYRGQLLFALEDTMSHMLWLGEKIITGEKDFNAAKILGRIEAVTPEDLMKVSKDMFKDSNLNLAVIGPIKEDSTLREVLHL
ncbi:MAG: insulinase family protein [Candidatus Omnitrophica bacterium]|nr:insulinase family protein [Candidatus Omnitrophota bacterium]